MRLKNNLEGLGQTQVRIGIAWLAIRASMSMSVLATYKYGLGDASIAGRLGIATLPKDFLAVGASAVIYEKRRDMILSTILQVPNSGFRFRASGGYLWGEQTFDFLSGEADIDLDQYSWLLSTSWVPSEEQRGNWLHSVGMSVWGARANQTSILTQSTSLLNCRRLLRLARSAHVERR